MVMAKQPVCHGTEAEFWYRLPVYSHALGPRLVFLASCGTLASLNRLESDGLFFISEGERNSVFHQAGCLEVHSL